MRRVLSLLAVVVLLLSIPALPSIAQTTTQKWILTGWNMTQIRTLDPVVADFHFNTPLALAMGNEDGTQYQVPSGYASTPTLKYESYAKLQQQIATLDPRITTLLYDPENWSQTPTAEKKNPGKYMRLFCELAHANGYVCVTTPSRDLMQVTKAVCAKRSGETLSEAYLRCNIPEAAALYADAYQIQSQVHENDPATYRWFVEAALNKARAVNPAIGVLAGLSTSPFDYVATPEMLFAAWSSTRDIVDGDFFTVNSAEVGMATEFLRMVQGELML
jgi:hypothetical protein